MSENTSNNQQLIQNSTEEIVFKAIGQIYRNVNDFKIDLNRNIITQISSGKTLDITNILSRTILSFQTSLIRTFGESDFEKFTKYTGEKGNRTMKSMGALAPWIVKYKQSGTPPTPPGVIIMKTFTVFKGIYCVSDQLTMDQFENNQHVAYVMLDVAVNISSRSDGNYLTHAQVVELEPQTIGSHIIKVGADHSSQASGNNTGSMQDMSNINIFIVDTGIAAHPDLNIVGGNNFTTSDPNDWVDRNGHGTHIAGVAAGKDNSVGVVGVAPGARLWSAKVLGDNGSGSASAVISGLDWILNSRNNGWSGFGIVNISFGRTKYLPIDDAVLGLISAGIVVVTSAGDGSINVSGTSPAGLYSAITTGATSDSPSYGDLASFSNYGQMVNILAPGTEIISTFLNNNYAILSGTEVAAPIVTGTCALMASTRYLGSPTSASYVGNVISALRYSSWLASYKNYDGTLTPNPAINLYTEAANAGTTNISVRSGPY